MRHCPHIFTYIISQSGENIIRVIRSARDEQRRARELGEERAFVIGERRQRGRFDFDQEQARRRRVVDQQVRKPIAERGAVMNNAAARLKAVCYRVLVGVFAPRAPVHNSSRTR